MKYPLILPLFACVIWASEKSDESFQSISISQYKTLPSDDGEQSESNAVETSNQTSNAQSPRFNRSSKRIGRKVKDERAEKKPRKSKKAFDWEKFDEERKSKQEKQEKKRKAKLIQDEEDYKDKEKKAMEAAKKKAEDNATAAKSLLIENELGDVFKYDEDTRKFSFKHYVETSTPRIFGCFNKKEPKPETLVIENVEKVKYAAGEDEVVIVVLSRPEKSNLPGKFEEFIVHVKKKMVEHNYINNLYGGDHFEADAQLWKPLYKKTTGGHVHYKNPDFGKKPLLEYMENQEERTIELFETSKNSKELKTNFELGGAQYGEFHHQKTMEDPKRRPRYSLAINHPLKN